MWVVKAGGRALRANLEGIAKSIASRSSSQKIVFVHGGGDIVSEVSKRMGIEPKFVTSPGGIKSRYTDLEELEAYVMVMCGKVNKSIVAALSKYGLKAIGVSGADGGLLIAERKKRIVIMDERGRKRAIEGGYTGQIKSVEKEILEVLLNAGYVVIVAPVAISPEGELLNVDGDTAATALAKALGVERVIYMSDVDGVLYDGELLERLTPDEAKDYASKIGPGMNRKLMLAAEAVEGGVSEAIICNGLYEDPLSELERGRKTLISK